MARVFYTDGTPSREVIDSDVCGFCGSSEDECGRTLRGVVYMICERCVRACVEALEK